MKVDVRYIDLDLTAVRDRHSGEGGGLSELLASMDVAARARILTLASTNDAAPTPSSPRSRTHQRQRPARNRPPGGPVRRRHRAAHYGGAARRGGQRRLPRHLPGRHVPLTSNGDDGVPELTESERVRLRATESDFAAMGDALRNGTSAPEDVEGASARFMSREASQRPAHPADAGPHAEAIETILRHIPDGWGRWISVDAKHSD